MKRNKKDALCKLVELMARLRGPSGCPWDKEQDFQSLIPYIIEEAYEVVEAIEEKDMNKLKEEMGDLLFQIVFLSQIACEKKIFDIDEVILSAHDKMVRRHPHVFGDEKAINPEEAIHTWNKAKKKETKSKDSLAPPPTHLPALLQAQRVSEKASLSGFDWKKREDVFLKLEEEVKELKDSMEQGIKERIEEEIGDIIFTLANLGRFLGINLEQSLRRTTNHFILRFNRMVSLLNKEGRVLDDMSLEDMESFWERAKGK